MANTYNVQLKQAVFTLHDASTITVADAMGQGNQVDEKATRAIGQFKHGEIVEIKGENDTTYIPFHAIIKVVVTETTQSASYEDNNCNSVCDCEGTSGGDDGEGGSPSGGQQ